MSSEMRSSNAEFSEFVGDMECNVAQKRNSRHHHISRTAKEFLSPGARRGVKLRDKLKPERHVDLSCADLHHEVTQNLNDRSSVLPKTSGNHQKQWMERRARDEDELVKYMSNLPGYLQHVEKAENLQEKALNFGVLDWRLLENWKYSQKQTSGRGSRYAPSTNNTSLEISANGSSFFSRGNSGSHSLQRKQYPSSVRPLLNSTPTEEHTQSIKTSRRNSTALQDLIISSSDPVARQQKPPRADQSYGKNYSEMKLEKGKRKDSVLNTQGIGTLSSIFKDDKMLSSANSKMKAPSKESEKKAEQLQGMDLYFADQQFPHRQESIVLLLPRDCPENSCSGISQLPESTTLGKGRSTEANRKSFSGDFYLDERVHFAEIYSDIPHSCPLPCGVESSKQPDLKRSGSRDIEDIRLPTDDASHSSPPHSEEIPTSQFEGKHAEESESTENLTNSTVIKPNACSNLTTAELAAAKGRNLSPSHRLGIGMGGMTRSLSSKERSTVPQLRSAYVTAKSGPVSSGASTCPDSNGSKTNANRRAKSSPLRRLLDPLLKPKAANQLNTAEPLQDETTATCKACKSSNGLLDSSSAHPVKRNLDSSNCRANSINDAHQDGKHESSSTMQADLQVMVKNGLPVFTFAVDGNIDLLAATMTRVSTSRKDEYHWVYTFCSFREMKKKNRGWMSQGGKGKNCRYKSNVVGQMKVSTSQSLKMVRELVLYGVGIRQGDQGTPEFQANGELAAVIVKVPKETTESLSNDGDQSKNYIDQSRMGLTKEKCSCNSGEDLLNGSVLNTIVILPSAVHGLPSTGGPSSLIDRWKSGGSCDCGGWDVGCRLSVLSNQDISSKKVSSYEGSPDPDRIELYVQDGASEKQQMFSLVPLKNGMYSVNFNESISLLQAFSICIAVLSSRESSDLSEVRSNFFRVKSLQESMSMENDRIKEESNQVQGEAPARYVSYPPLSPVGRV